MADPYHLLERDARETESALDLADHNRTWAQTFNSPQSTPVLRANRNYDELLTNAIDQRSQIGALHDPKAQKMRHEERLQPLREQLLQGQIDHQAASTLAAGALERFHQKKDQETMADTVGYLDWLEKAKHAPGTEGYQAHALEGLKKFPRIITTAAGKELLKNIAEENDGIAKLHDATVTRYAKVKGEVASHETAVKREEKENIAALKPDVPYSKSDELHAAETEAAILEGAHPELKGVVPKPSATPKRLKYNPATGALE